MHSLYIHIDGWDMPDYEVGIPLIHSIVTEHYMKLGVGIE